MMKKKEYINGLNIFIHLHIGSLAIVSCFCQPAMLCGLQTVDAESNSSNSSGNMR